MFLRKSLLILLALCASFLWAIEGDKDNDYFTGIKEGGDLDDEADDDIEKHIEGDVLEEEEKVEEPPVERVSILMLDLPGVIALLRPACCCSPNLKGGTCMQLPDQLNITLQP